jgi:hypothetical protein
VCAIQASVCAIGDLRIKVIYLLSYLSETATKSVTLEDLAETDASVSSSPPCPAPRARAPSLARILSVGYFAFVRDC